LPTLRRTHVETGEMGKVQTELGENMLAQTLRQCTNSEAQKGVPVEKQASLDPEEGRPGKEVACQAANRPWSRPQCPTWNSQASKYLAAPRKREATRCHRWRCRVGLVV
jgi:hypothetical protein